MRPLVALTPLAALLLACGEPPPPPPPAKAEPAPAPAEPPKPAAPLGPPTGRALLVATEYGLSPIACFFDQAREYAAGEACLALAPTGTEVWMMSGQAAKVTGRGQTSCPDAPPEATLQIAIERDLLRGDAVLPPTLKDGLTYVAPTRPDEVDRAAPKELRVALDRAVKAAFPDLAAAKLRVDQRAELDLDGDGALEQIVAVTVPPAKPADDAPLRLSALFLLARDGAPALLRGRPDTRERYAVLGALDLDGDGRRELYLNTYDDDAFSLSLEQQTPTGLEARGRWTCGA